MLEGPYDSTLDLQMVSLLHLADIQEEGVVFRSPVDGKRMALTPEHSMAIQNRLGGQVRPSTQAKISEGAIDTAVHMAQRVSHAGQCF